MLQSQLANFQSERPPSGSLDLLHEFEIEIFAHLLAENPFERVVQRKLTQTSLLSK